MADIAPYDLASCPCLYAEGRRVKIVRLTRRHVVVDRYGARYQLRRRPLETTGVAYVGELAFRVTTSPLPHELRITEAA